MRLKIWILLAGAMTGNLLSINAEDSFRVTVGSGSGESENGQAVQPSIPQLPTVPIPVVPFESQVGLATVPVMQPVANGSTPMLLQPLQSQAQSQVQSLAPMATGANAPVGVIPMTRLASLQPADATGGPFRTADMIGPMGDATKFLSQWSTPDSNTFIPVEPLPVVRGYRQDPQTLVGWAGSTYPWISPVFHYHPLYFEQPNLERYGNGTHPIFQPAVSSAHFFSSLALVPYKTLTHHPREKVYTLGTLRPGNCNPSDRHTLIGQSRVGELFHYWNPKSGY